MREKLEEELRKKMYQRANLDKRLSELHKIREQLAKTRRTVSNCFIYYLVIINLFRSLTIFKRVRTFWLNILLALSQTFINSLPKMHLKKWLTLLMFKSSKTK